MRTKISAGILLYRRRESVIEYFLVHPGGPFWKNKDEGVWSVPKGEVETVRSSQYAVRSAQSAVRSKKASVSASGVKRLEEEELFEVAKREFQEETSFALEDCVKKKADERVTLNDCIVLSPVKLKSGKMVHAFAVEGDIDAEKIVSNTFMYEWPPRSGKKIEIPEVDRGEWFIASEAKLKINERQVALIEHLEQMLA
jgi:predicted NUDIX family NTP pyrophosphohydrolase